MLTGRWPLASRWSKQRTGLQLAGQARVGLRRGAGRVRAVPGRVADVVRDLQDGRRRTPVWNDGMLFHSAELMANP